MTLFRVSMYDSNSIIITPADNIDTGSMGALINAMDEAPTKRWTNKYGMRGWVLPCNQPTLEFLDDRWVAHKDYELARQAEISLMREKVEREVQKGRASKRWHYLFEGTPSDFIILSQPLFFLERQK